MNPKKTFYNLLELFIYNQILFSPIDVVMYDLIIELHKCNYL